MHCSSVIVTVYYTIINHLKLQKEKYFDALVLYSISCLAPFEQQINDFCFFPVFQGFQLIVKPCTVIGRSARASSSDPAPAPTTPQSSTTTNPLAGAASALARSRSRGTTSSEPSEEYLLSIGRIFHKIALNGSAITVTRYRPR